MKNIIDFKEFSLINFPIGTSILLSSLFSSLITILYILLTEKSKIFFVVYGTGFIFIFIGMIFVYTCNAIHSYIQVHETYSKQNAENKIIDRTLSFIQRWNDPENLRFRRVAGEIYQSFEKQPLAYRESFIVKHLEDNTKERQDITNLLNFFEEIAICIEEGIVKEELLIKFFKSILFSFYEVYYPYIQDRRKKKESYKIYKSLTDLCERWSKSDLSQ